MDFDPTNGSVGNTGVVTIAVVPDPRHAIPLHGTFIGFPSDRYALTKSRQSSASSRAARPVEPTRSQNMTVTGRRSAETWWALAGADLAWGAARFGEGVAPAKAEIAASNLRRSPTASTPISLRSSAVSRQLRKHFRIDLVVSKLLLVLVEAETAKPLADFHGRAPHGLTE